MADYKLTFARSARKELEQLEATIVDRILPKIEDLVQEPRPKNCTKLRGASQLWRIRVGDYRVIYSIDDEAQIVDVTAVRHRKDAYR